MNTLISKFLKGEGLCQNYTRAISGWGIEIVVVGKEVSFLMDLLLIVSGKIRNVNEGENQRV